VDEKKLVNTIVRAIRNGNPCSLSSDDPVVFDCNIEENYAIIANMMLQGKSGISDEVHECFIFMQEQAIANAFCTKELKEELMRILRRDPIYSEKTKRVLMDRLSSSNTRILNVQEQSITVDSKVGGKQPST